MARVIAFSAVLPQRLQLAEALRSAIVLGCAMALILADRALPF